MRDLTELNQYRRPDLEITRIGAYGGRGEGVFIIQHLPTAATLRILASSGDGWDHVSVSLRDRCPTWTEMEFVKRLFFRSGETAMQLHVPAAAHINRHPFTLHLWRPQAVPIPRPPIYMV